MNLDHILTIIIILYYLIAVIIGVSILLENHNPHKTTAYLIAVLVFPIVGLLFYLFFGQSYRKRKIFSRKGILDNKQLTNWSQRQILKFEKTKDQISDLLEEKIKIAKLFIKNEKAVLTQNNKVEILTNGENTFPRIIEDLQNAKDHIHLEYYIFCDDKIGNTIKDVLIKKVQEGIKVRIIYDDVGSDLNNKFLKKLRKLGIEIYPFMPVLFSNFTSKANYRNHRKIIVIDGKIGFLGGINIADKYINGDKKSRLWRDTHLRIEGDAVKSLQILFLLNWQFVSGKDVHTENLTFPTCRVKEKKLIQIVGSGPDSDYASIMQAYFMAITNARNYVYISTPYFIPNDQILTALITSALSGVDVQLIIPEKCDSKMVNGASHSYIEGLLEAGIKVYLYKGGFIHAKVMIVDDLFASLGTANMDYRSFDINFEVNALIYDKEIAQRLLQDYNTDRDRSEPIKLEEWKNRGFIRKLRESMARTLAPLL